MDQVAIAKMIATQAHVNQFDKGGNPYINHPATVASFVKTDNEKIVAWLHDVVEDTKITLNILSTFFPHKIIEAVDAITRRENEPRDVYLRRVCKNRLATTVKIADLKHNCDLSRITNRKLEEKDYIRVAKYENEIKMLKLGEV